MNAIPSRLDALLQRLPDAARDARLNLPAVLARGDLDVRHRWGVALAVALHEGDPALIQALRADGAEHLDEALVTDATAAATLMAMNNVYYRFRHQVGRDAYGQLRAGLRMNHIARPATDRATFELLSLAVSAVNGCEACVRSHEASVRQEGLTEAHVHDAVRIAAVVRSVHVAARIASAAT